MQVFLKSFLGLFGLLLIGLVACKPTSHPTLACVQQLVEATNKHQVEALAALYDSSVVISVNGSTVLHSRAELRQALKSIFAESPDYHLQLAYVIANDSSASIEHLTTGTHAATHRTIIQHHARILTWRHGLIVRESYYFDNLEYQRQVEPFHP